MQFTKRQKAVLLYLNNRSAHLHSEVPGKLIAGHLQISLRTLQNTIADINRSGYGTIVESNNKGYFFNEEAICKLHLTPKSQEEDIDAILKYLLLEHQLLDLDEMAEQFFLSSSSLQKKLKKISGLLKRYELTVSRNKNRIVIQGAESQKRHMIHDMIMREIGLTYDSLDIASHYLKNINTVEIQSIIMAAIQRHHYFVENCYTTNLVINILTALSRIYDHCDIEEVFLENHDQIPEYWIAYDICEESRNLFAIPIVQKDICYITMLIMGQVKPVEEKNSSALIESEQTEILIKIIQNTFSAYMLNIDYNTFLPNFIRHIQALLIRGKNKQFVINLITENIKETSPFVYDVAVHLAKSLEDRFDVRIIDEEIGLLSIYIGFIIEQSSLNNEIVNVLIVCNDYKDIAGNILKKLKQNCQDSIDILDVVTTAAKVSGYKNIDLIIHTIPLNILGRVSVLISPFYSNDDAEKVNAAVSSILGKKKRLQNQKLLLTYFNENLYFKNHGITDKSEAISFLGGQIEKSGLCEPGFTESVHKREAMSSTCFMKTFAVPHAIELNARRTCFSVLVEEGGIFWDDSKIHCVFMIAVCREDRKEFMKIYSGIIQFLLQKDAIDLLMKASNFRGFINCLTEND
ncbi:putative licABCH operon regulator [Clostridium sp. C105KSO15]|nr:putative licABCH operon regulator [Clostridium sp. C105KSO15]